MPEGHQLIFDDLQELPEHLLGELTVASEFFDGERSSVSGTLTIRPNEHLLLEGGAQRNRIELAGHNQAGLDLATLEISAG